MRKSSESQQKLKKSSASGIAKFFELLDKHDITATEFQLLRDLAYAPEDIREVMCQQKPTQINTLVLLEMAETIGIGAGCLTPTAKPTEKAYTLFKEVEKLFKPIKSKNTGVVIDLAMVKAYNELFPAIKYPHSDKYARCNEADLVSAFTRFFGMYPTFTSWDIILKVTQRYLQGRERENWNYARTSKYFVIKQMPDKSYVSNLAEHYKMELDGIGDNTPQNFADEKVV